MKVEIVPGRLLHCGRIARALRVDHTYALMRRNVSIHYALRDQFAKSFYTRAALINGHLVALWGAEGTLLGSSAFLWLALSQYVTRFPMTVLRQARREIQALAQTRQELVTTVVPEDEAAVRLATFLGFEAPDGFGGGPARSPSARRNLCRYIGGNPELMPPGTSQVAMLYRSVWHRSD